MLTSIQKIILIPAFVLSAGFLFSLDRQSSSKLQTPYPEHLAGAFTGGFGEQTCHSCHFDYDLNWKEGSLSVMGIPNTVEAGEAYEFTITVKRENLGRSGFQFTARFKDGRQAGVFHIKDDPRVMFTKEVPDSLQYVQHSKLGTFSESRGENNWQINWEAPDSIDGSIQFHIAANAANGDQSEFGDWIYVEEISMP